MPGERGGPPFVGAGWDSPNQFNRMAVEVRGRAGGCQADEGASGDACPPRVAVVLTVYAYPFVSNRYVDIPRLVAFRRQRGESPDDTDRRLGLVSTVRYRTVRCRTRSRDDLASSARPGS